MEGKQIAAASLIPQQAESFPALIGTSKPGASATSRIEARYQALAACGAVIVAFIGVCHEYAGPLIFPWAPVLLGPVGWHGLGIFAIVSGLLVLAGTLHLIRFPVVTFGILAAVLGVGIGLFTAIAHGQFHLLAFIAAAAGATTAFFHRDAGANAPP